MKLYIVAFKSNNKIIIIFQTITLLHLYNDLYIFLKIICSVRAK